jgi:hypothetical protein
MSIFHLPQPPEASDPQMLRYYLVMESSRVLTEWERAVYQSRIQMPPSFVETGKSFEVPTLPISPTITTAPSADIELKRALSQRRREPLTPLLVAIGLASRHPNSIQPILRGFDAGIKPIRVTYAPLNGSLATYHSHFIESSQADTSGLSPNKTSRMKSVTSRLRRFLSSNRPTTSYYGMRRYPHQPSQRRYQSYASSRTPAQMSALAIAGERGDLGKATSGHRLS